MSKIIIEQNDWHEVYKDLKEEKLKPSTYDDYVISLMGDVKDKRILDYGCGPGVIAKELKNMGGIVDIYDINKQILHIAREQLNICDDIAIDNIQKNIYDFVLCNLVVCIVEDNEVIDIAEKIYNFLKQETGITFIGFCNPKIYNIRETQLDIRHSGNTEYEKNHTYYKEKKEGGYVIPEKHRPIEWYNTAFENVGFKVEDILYTPGYSYKGKELNDFVIFKLRKE